MYYEINISQNGRHLFATAERSITSASAFARVAGELLRRFPASEGFAVTATRYETRGVSIPIDNSPED